MKSILFSFSFADILSRRNDFYRDIRSVGDAKGQILTCHNIVHENADNIVAGLWMSDCSGKRYSVISLAAFFDPCYVCDVIIIPELKLSFRYQWDCSDFYTEKVMSIIDDLCREKTSDITLCEWDLLCAAAAVCAVYEFRERLCFVDAVNSMMCELLEDKSGGIGWQDIILNDGL